MISLPPPSKILLQWLNAFPWVHQACPYLRVFAFAVPSSRKALLTDIAEIAPLRHSGLCSIVSLPKSLSLTILSKITLPSLSSPHPAYLFHDIFFRHIAAWPYGTYLFLSLSLLSPLECTNAGNFSVLFTTVLLAPKNFSVLKILAAIHF